MEKELKKLIKAWGKRRDDLLDNSAHLDGEDTEFLVARAKAGAIRDCIEELSALLK
jgi:hypothetical protein